MYNTEESTQDSTQEKQARRATVDNLGKNGKFFSIFVKRRRVESTGFIWYYIYGILPFFQKMGNLWPEHKNMVKKLHDYQYIGTEGRR